MKYALGLDVSPLRIGWAFVLIEGALIRPVAHGTHLFNKDIWVTPSMRAEVIEDLHELTKISPIIIGLEGVFVGPNKIGSIRAAMALGQIESICDYEWPEAEQKVLTPPQWRKYCDIPQGGKGPVLDWSQEFVGELLDSQDTADAIAIAYAVSQWREQSSAE